MSGPLVSASAAFVAKNSRIPPFAIEQSLRIAQGSYLYRTNSSSGNRYTWTYSCWVKRGTFTQAIDAILAANQNYGNDWDSDSLQFNTGNFGLQIYNNRSQSTRANGTTNAKYRDPSAWMHIVAVWDNTNSTATDKFRYYINGERATIAWNTTPTGDSSLINSTTTMRIGQNASVNSEKYMAEVHFIDGTAVTNANDFGEYDNNGVWRPIEYTGSYGTNGFYLKFDPSATNGVGHDHSGNGNNWSLQNIVTSGTGTDVMSDTPTTNYPTLNPIYTTPPYPTQQQSGTLSEGNLAITFTGVDGGNGPTFSVVPNSGKWYFEAKQTSGDNTNISLGFYGNYTANFDNAWRIVHTNGGGGFFYSFQGPESGSEPSGTVSYSSGDILGIEIDMDNSTLQFHVNGTYATKATGLSFASYAPLWIDFRRQNSSGTNNSWLFNFGQRAFEYTPTSGFNALNTSNLSAPAIKDGSDYFNTVLYTATQTAQSITGVGFQPDLVWGKRRNGTAASHNLFDVIRGVRTHLQSNTTNAETTEAAGASLTSFDTDGFSVGTPNAGPGAINSNTGDLLIAWNWKAGGSVSADNNTDGSITSTVSVNPSAGFSIVSYASGAAGQKTVGHGLGVAPDLIITKSRDGSTFNWAVFHSAVCDTTSKFLRLNTGDPLQTSSTIWGAALPTSTVFGITSGGGVEANDDCIAYCFAEVEGYSKFGSYAGNGNADGPFIYLGFKPAWLLIKNNTTAQGWYLNDSARNPYNLNYLALFPSSDAAESASTGGAAYDFLSNGFKPRTANNDSNGSGDTYIYMAFAENPFGGSGVSPATAR